MAVFFAFAKVDRIAGRDGRLDCLQPVEHDGCVSDADTSSGTLAGVAKEMTEQVEIVLGVVGPERIVADNLSIDIRFDRELRRYICHELTVYRSVVGQPSGPVTTEILRKQVQIEQMIRINVLVNYPDRPPTMRELDNPGRPRTVGL